MYDYDYQQTGKGDRSGEIPVRRRSCTDIICLILFIAFWAATGGLMVKMRNTGDFSKIMRPYDGGNFL